MMRYDKLSKLTVKGREENIEQGINRTYRYETQLNI